MSYTAEHKQATRERIIECARQLFNRKGFTDVSVNEIMQAAGLTHGGFYNHFASKDELFVEAIEAYGHCNPADRWPGVELDFSQKGRKLAKQMIDAYLSTEHLRDLEGHCPMIALPSDVSRAGPAVRRVYETGLKNMATIFEGGEPRSGWTKSRRRALSLVALCIGGMVLARTVNDKKLANEIREAARSTAHKLTNSH